MGKKKTVGQRIEVVHDDPELPTELRSINKSEMVRQYLRDNPGAKPKETAEELSRQLNVSLTPAFVSQIKLKMSKSGGTPKRAQPSGGGTVVDNGRSADGFDILTIEAAKTLVRKVGADNLKRLIDVLS